MNVKFAALNFKITFLLLQKSFFCFQNIAEDEAMQKLVAYQEERLQYESTAKVLFLLKLCYLNFLFSVFILLKLFFQRKVYKH